MTRRRYPPKPGAAKRQLDAMDRWFGTGKDSKVSPPTQPQGTRSRRPRPKTALIAEAAQRKAVDSRESWTDLERLAYEVQVEHGKGKR